MQNLVTVFGGSGFVGSQAVRALAKQGWRIRVAVRQPNLAYEMRLHGDVGQVDIIQANVRNEASVRRALEGASACVNLVGVLYETGRQKFQALHAMGAKTVATAARLQGATRFVQMSALGADPDAPSGYARSKAMGEAAVRETFPEAVVLRPSIVFGQNDAFFNRFAAMARLSPVLPLVGAATRLQPVFVGDVARAVVRMLAEPQAAGRTYELGGPAQYDFRRLMELMLAEIHRRRILLPLPFPVAALIGKGGDLIAGAGLKPPLTSDQVEMLRRDNVVSGTCPGLADLGLTATTLEAVLPTYLYRYRKGGQFADQEERVAAV
ncbi:complex I NDUFA9 subunit family protein [Phenylobacterium sp.]|jgi:NADH dehydrogenase|uniref:complex I NDUFA9 subunit family protein n=1 Tax=Phenylobacterium sp. TaxID=1871053 RepID=UPI002F40EA25